MTVTQFTGGKRCKNCDEQIDPKRVRAVPGARLCVACQNERDGTLIKAHRVLDQVSKNSVVVPDRASVTIKW